MMNIKKVLRLKDWETTTLRVMAWLILSIGMTVDIFIVDHAVQLTLERVWAVPTDSVIAAAQRAGAIKSIELTLICLICMVTVAMVVALDYNLRAGEQKGRLLQRIGLAAVIELAIFVIGQLVAG